MGGMGINRVILIVLDSVGVGALPDADQYGDAGTNTLAHVAQQVGGLRLPNFAALGLGHIGEFCGIEAVPQPLGCFGKFGELSAGKDTSTGHWEMMGIISAHPFPTYPEGFPPEIIQALTKEIGRLVLGNKTASGTEIMDELGAQHMQTGWPIVYTSADSVFQIAAHEEIIPVDELYRMCESARKMLTFPHNVLRVIARPFVGKPGDFHRTERRRDFSLTPPGDTLLDKLQRAGIPTVGIGKIGDIFAQRGLDADIHTKNNMDGVDKILDCMRRYDRGVTPFKGLIFANLVDFDTQWVMELDRRLPEITGGLRPGDLLIFTSDHGCDPTTPGTDHTREYGLLLAYGPSIKSGVNWGTRRSFADLGQTLAKIFNVPPLPCGCSLPDKSTG